MDDSRPLVQEGPNDLLPLAKPKALGLPFARRTLSRKLQDEDFPPVVRIGMRLFVRRADLENYKSKLAGVVSE